MKTEKRDRKTSERECRRIRKAVKKTKNEGETIFAKVS
jgi:hypothetical protein